MLNCETCIFYNTELSSNEYEYNMGVCMNDKVGGDLWSWSREEDTLVPVPKSDFMLVGPKFGCVHHAEKEKIDA